VAPGAVGAAGALGVVGAPAALGAVGAPAALRAAGVAILSGANKRPHSPFLADNNTAGGPAAETSISVAAAAADSVTTAVRVAAATVNIGAATAAVNDVSTVAFERIKRSRLTETDDF
jgi:hypothetical protein